MDGKEITDMNTRQPIMTLERCSENNMAIMMNGQVVGMLSATRNIDSTFLSLLTMSLIFKTGEEDKQNHELETYLEDGQ